MNNIICKIADNASELEFIAKCRIDAFPNSLSSKLGINYVKKLLSFYLTKENFLIYLSNGKECVGFVTGMVPELDFICSTREAIDLTYRDILKGLLNKPWLIFHPIILSNFKLVIELIKNKAYLSKQNEKIMPARTPSELKGSVGLIDIAVSPKYQGNGYSNILLNAFENKCYEKGLNKMHLSVKPENIKAIQSYLRNGWKIFEKLPRQLTFIKNK
jgi:ribosomal protein S18 acetylase RimI-like enzyme